jgi:hypothetical protein
MIVGGDPGAIGRLLDSLLESWHFPIREVCVWSEAPLDEPALEAFHGVLDSAAARVGISTHPRLFNACPLSVAVESVQSAVCVVLSQHVLARGATTPWEALKHFELFPDAVAMGGRILDSGSIVREAGAVAPHGGRLHAVFSGLEASNPGTFAMALKPQTLDQPSLDAFFVRREFLLRSVGAEGGLGSAGAIAAAVAREALRSGARIGMSPLIEFTLQEGARADRETLAPNVLQLPLPGAGDRRLSEWGFVAAAGQYR